jgi:hypothetical protein
MVVGQILPLQHALPDGWQETCPPQPRQLSPGAQQVLPQVAYPVLAGSPDVNELPLTEASRDVLEPFPQPTTVSAIANVTLDADRPLPTSILRGCVGSHRLPLAI